MNQVCWNMNSDLDSKHKQILSNCHFIDLLSKHIGYFLLFFIFHYVVNVNKLWKDMVQASPSITVSKWFSKYFFINLPLQVETIEVKNLKSCSHLPYIVL
jgi:hypothetical protein